MKKLNECTIIAGKKDDSIFLFKNHDAITLYDSEVIKDIVDGVEITYYSNQHGWVEGLNEFGIGFVYAYFTRTALEDTENYRMKTKTIKEPGKVHTDPLYVSPHKGKYLLSILTSKKIEEALDKIVTGNWDGNYFLSDGKIIYEIEKFKGETEHKVVELNKKNNFIVKTNHGILIPTAGEIKGQFNLKRASSEIRRNNAKRYLLGYKDFVDVIKKMSFQEFDKKSTFNSFRTDLQENTLSQILLDLTNKEFNLVYYDEISKFLGIFDKLPKDYKSKIKINVFDREKFKSSEYETFMNKVKDLQNFKIS